MVVEIEETFHTAGPDYESRCRPVDGFRRPSDPAQARSEKHAQMLSLEDSAIRVAVFLTCGEQRNKKESFAWK
jgi:hypothetical protein